MCGNTRRKEKKTKETGRKETEELCADLVQQLSVFSAGMCEDVADVVWLRHFQLARFIGRCLLG